MRTTASILTLLWATACTHAPEPGTAGELSGVGSGTTADESEGEPEPAATTTGEPEPEATTSDPEPEATTTGEPEPEATTGEPEPEATTGEPEPPPGLGCEGRDDLLLCDDFEGDGVDAELWDVVEANGGQVVIDGTLAYHGGGALRIHLPAGEGARGGLRTRPGVVFPVADNHFFGRAWFHVGPTVPETHSAALTARGQLQGALAQYRLDSNGERFNSRYAHPPTVVDHGGLKKFGYDVPAEQWLCIEWEYDGEHDGMRYWMNGDEVTDMTVTEGSEPQPWVAPVFDDFEIGWRTFQAAQSAPAHDVVWDAVALATFRIGCE